MRLVFRPNRFDRSITTRYRAWHIGISVGPVRRCLDRLPLLNDAPMDELKLFKQSL